MAAYAPSLNTFNPFFIDICRVSSGTSSIVVIITSPCSLSSLFSMSYTSGLYMCLYDHAQFLQRLYLDSFCTPSFSVLSHHQLWLSLLHPTHYPHCSQCHTPQGCICVYMIMHGFFKGCILTHFVPLHFLYCLDHLQQSCSSRSLLIQCHGFL